MQELLKRKDELSSELKLKRTQNRIEIINHCKSCFEEYLRTKNITFQNYGNIIQATQGNTRISYEGDVATTPRIGCTALLKISFFSYPNSIFYNIPITESNESSFSELTSIIGKLNDVSTLEKYIKALETEIEYENTFLLSNYRFNIVVNKGDYRRGSVKYYSKINDVFDVIMI